MGTAGQVWVSEMCFIGTRTQPNIYEEQKKSPEAVLMKIVRPGK